MRKSWTQENHVLDRCLHRRHLANTIGRFFFRGGYAALGRITLIICYILGRIACTKSKEYVIDVTRSVCVC